jgi:hypothetical protein
MQPPLLYRELPYLPLFLASLLLLHAASQYFQELVIPVLVLVFWKALQPVCFKWSIQNYE